MLRLNKSGLNCSKLIPVCVSTPLEIARNVKSGIVAKASLAIKAPIVSFLIFVYLLLLRPMKIPYLWPLVPFFPTAFSRVIIRFPMAEDAPRPFIVGAKNRKRS